jgi:peptide/nickel transport system ATP-binding protein
VSGLKTHFFIEDGVVKAVDGVDFHINQGEILGLVGESGCGKSVTVLSIMRLIGVPGRIVSGEVIFENRDLLKLSENEIQDIRGNQISMIFQQPQSSLNPVFSIGDQLTEVFQIHTSMNKNEAWERAVELLHVVGIPDAEQKAHAYPHEMSGGQAQRVMIAMALALRPTLLIADEPTTALDVTIQAQILDLVRDLRNQMGTAVILITHDLGVVAEIADRAAVMYAGQIVEGASVAKLFEQPLHPYTLGLIESIPVLAEQKERLDVIEGTVPDLIDLPEGCRFAPRCRAREEYELTICTEKKPEHKPVQSDHSVRCWLYQDQDEHKAPLSANLRSLDIARKEPAILVEQENNLTKDKKNGKGKDLLRVQNLVKYFPVRAGILQRIVDWVQAVDGVSFTIREGETLGLVGESGCGKSTVGNTILRLIEPTEGYVEFGGTNIFGINKRDIKPLRKDMQIIFQDPYSSLNPRKPVGDSIMAGLNIHKIGTKQERYDILRETLQKVGMDEYHAQRYPHEFSGGQRQRIGIARAIALHPKFIVCDEPVSALDVSIQSQVLNLLQDLQEEFGLTYLFIAHNLSVVEHFSDRVAVMYLGKIVELAPRSECFSLPLHPYTQALMSAIPIPKPDLERDRIILEGEVPSPLNPPSGCHFHPRCPIAIERCSVEVPELIEHNPEHWVACFRVSKQISVS